MSLAGKKSFNIFIVFIGILLCTETVTSSINYNEIRHGERPYEDQAEAAGTTREILEIVNNRAMYRPILDFQQATEHLLHFGALLRIQILDIFGPLVYGHHDDYNDQQKRALYRVYQDTLERKYNIFDIVPSVLRNPDIRPTNICRHIHKYVHTCLKESSMTCMTISKDDQPHTQSSVSHVVDITKQMYKRFYIKERFSNGFSLPAILDHLKTGTLHLTVGLMSGLVHNIQYDSFNDEVRTAERSVMIILTSQMLDSDEHIVPMKKDGLLHVDTVSDLLKELFRPQSTARITDERNKNFAILSEHVVDDVQEISENVVLLSTVYDDDRIDMKYLLDLILPRDVVDEDITDAKNYILEKINDYDIVDKYLKVEKYRQSSPDQLLLEILGQMRDIYFAVDIVTALHVHARFWRQSHMINSLNELLELFDAYKNLEYVPKYSSFMSLTDKIRNTLRNSKNVTVQLLCNNPRVCLRLGLETVKESEFIDGEIKNDIDKLFYQFCESGVIPNADEHTMPMNSAQESDEPQTTQNPTIISGENLTDFTNREELVNREVYAVEATSVELEQTVMPIETNAEETTVVLTTEGNAAWPTTTEILTELLANRTKNTTILMPTLATQDARETTEQQTTDSKDEELTTTPVTIEKPVFPDVSNELTIEAQATEDQTTERLETGVHATLEPTSVKLALQLGTTTADQTTTEKEPSIQEATSTAQEYERLTTEEELGTQKTTTTKQRKLDEEITTEEAVTTKRESTESTEQSSLEEEITTKRTRTTTTSPGGSTTKSMIADETITPKNDDDCYGDACTTEILNDSTGILPDALHTDHSPPPHLSPYNTGAAESLRVPTTTVIPTTRENSIMISSVSEITTTSSSLLASENTTSLGKKPGLSKEPKFHGVNSSGESNTTEQNYHHDCSGDDCPSNSPNVGVSKKTEVCEGDECSRPSSESDDLSTRPPLANSNIPDCVDGDCSKVSKSKESACNGDVCIDADESRPSVAVKETEPAFSPLTPHTVQWDNKDPTTTLQATAPTSNTLPPSRPIKVRVKLVSQKLPPWLRRPLNKTLDHYLPWRPISQHPFQTHKSRNDEFGQHSVGIGAMNRMKKKPFLNMNANLNFISLRNHADADGDIGDAATPEPQILQTVDPPNSSYRRVVTEVSDGLGSGERDQKPQHESDVNPELEVPSEKSPDISRRREVSPMRMKPGVHQTKESDDNIERMRKSRSIIRAPRRAGRRYLR